MMNEITSNKNEFVIGGVGFRRIDNDLYVSAEDTAKGFGFTQIKKGVEYIRWETLNTMVSEITGFPNKLGKGDYIIEDTFYKVGMRAKNETAKAFQNKVVAILKEVRQTGAYIAPQPVDEDSDDLAIINGYKALMRKVERLEAKVAIMEDKASYYDIVLATKDLVPITLIAKDYGMSATEMNKILHEHGYQYKRNKTWVLYDKYADKGYTSSKTHIYEDCYGREHSQMSTQWTQSGRLFIYNELKKYGILPMVEQRLI